MTEDNWISTTATVTTCQYQSPALSTMLIGFNTRARFRITFDYYAHGKLYSDEIGSPTAIPQNSTLPLTYNPLDPKENSRSHSPTAKSSMRGPGVLAFGIAGSLLLSLLWLLLLRGCS